MRIFLAFLSSANTLEFSWSRIWYINFNLTLKKMGIDVVLPSYDVSAQHLKCVYGKSVAERTQACSHYSERLWNDIKSAYSSKGIDLFFSYLYAAAIDPMVIERIKELGIPTVNFYCNSIHQFSGIEQIAPHFDYCMFPEREAYKSYLAVGANPVHIQMAANPDFYKPYELPRIHQVSFAGQNYLNRKNYITYLLDAGIPVRVWGTGWQVEARLRRVLKRKPIGGHLLNLVEKQLLGGIGKFFALPYGPALSDEELVRLFSLSRISLGFSEVQMPDGKINRHIRLRDFEAPMSGALYFTGKQEELEEYYVIGEEIVCYETSEDLLEKIRYYLSHEAEANRVREAGLTRARRDHTWKNRFEQLFQLIGLHTP